MPTLRGTSPNKKNPRDMTIESDDDPSWLRIWAHPPNPGDKSGWTIRVRKSEFLKFIQDLP
jgi:hypothetical protein